MNHRHRKARRRQERVAVDSINRRNLPCAFCHEPMTLVPAGDGPIGVCKGRTKYIFVTDAGEHCPAASYDDLHGPREDDVT